MSSMALLAFAAQTGLAADGDQVVIERIAQLEERDIGLETEMDFSGRPALQILHCHRGLRLVVKGLDVRPFQASQVQSQLTVRRGQARLGLDEGDEATAKIAQIGETAGGILRQVGHGELVELALAEDSAPGQDSHRKNNRSIETNTGGYRFRGRWKEVRRSLGLMNVPTTSAVALPSDQRGCIRWPFVSGRINAEATSRCSSRSSPTVWRRVRSLRFFGDLDMRTG